MAEKFADDIVEELIERLAQGEGLATICKDRRMPNRRTVHRWMHANDELAERIMSAREIGFHDRAERAVQEVRDTADPIKARAVFDAERWYLSKLSQAFADKPIVGVSLNVGDVGDAFSAITSALDRAAAAVSSSRSSTFIVDQPSPPGSTDAAGRLEHLDGDGGPGLREDEAGG